MNIKKILNSKLVRAFMKEHQRRENLPRTVCSECQFESNEEDESHAPGCSKAKKKK